MSRWFRRSARSSSGTWLPARPRITCGCQSRLPTTSRVFLDTQGHWYVAHATRHLHLPSCWSCVYVRPSPKLTQEVGGFVGPIVMYGPVNNLATGRQLAFTHNLTGVDPRCSISTLHARLSCVPSDANGHCNTDSSQPYCTPTTANGQCRGVYDRYDDAEHFADFACGLVLHEGTSCADEAALGGAYGGAPYGPDHWRLSFYSATADGNTFPYNASEEGAVWRGRKAVGTPFVSYLEQGVFDLDTALSHNVAVAGRAFVVYDFDGNAIACTIARAVEDDAADALYAATDVAPFYNYTGPLRVRGDILPMFSDGVTQQAFYNLTGFDPRWCVISCCSLARAMLFRLHVQDISCMRPPLIRWRPRISHCVSSEFTWVAAPSRPTSARILRCRRTSRLTTTRRPYSAASRLAPAGNRRSVKSGTRLGVSAGCGRRRRFASTLIQAVPPRTSPCARCAALLPSTRVCARRPSNRRTHTSPSSLFA